MWTKTKLVLAISMATASTSGAAQQIESHIDTVFAPWASATKPGCSVGVERQGQRTLRAYGLADMEHSVPNVAETIYEAGSVSKQFAAAAVLLLARDKKLRLDDDIRKYLPEMPDYGKTITIDHLLTHTSGLRDWGFLTEIEGWPRTTRAMTQPDILDMATRQTELNHAPGDEYSYTNTGYNLLAIIVERVSGQRFGEFSKQKLFAPLGMNSTSWRDDFRRIVPGRAIAYIHTATGYEQRMPFEDAVGAGGLLTTVGDLLTWNRSLTERTFGDFFVTEFERRGKLNNGREIRYARGLRIESRHGKPEISHAGATGAYRAWLARFPDSKLSIAVLCNAGDVGGSAAAIGYKLADRLLPPAPAIKPVRVAGSVAAYQGMFIAKGSGMPMTLIADGPTLKIDGGATLTTLGNGRFRMNEDVIAFTSKDHLRIEDPDGSTQEYRRTEPVSAVAPEPYLGRFVSDELGVAYFVELREGKLSLRLERRPAVTVSLKPAYRDAFLYDTRFGPGTAIVRYERDAAGGVTAIRIGWNNRVHGVRFTRAKS